MEGRANDVTSPPAAAAGGSSAEKEKESNRGSKKAAPAFTATKPSGMSKLECVMSDCWKLLVAARLLTNALYLNLRCLPPRHSFNKTSAADDELGFLDDIDRGDNGGKPADVAKTTKQSPVVLSPPGAKKPASKDLLSKLQEDSDEGGDPLAVLRSSGKRKEEEALWCATPPATMSAPSVLKALQMQLNTRWCVLFAW